jgi:hypothetical protein
MVFLSYSRSQSDYADKIEQYLRQRHIALVRDTHDENATDSISGFIRRISASDFVILLISDAYLKSYYCLYEALLAYSHRDKRNLIPILLPDADILTWEGQADYLSYWSEASRNLRAKIQSMPVGGTGELQNALRQIDAYGNYLGDFLAYIKDTVCIFQKSGDAALGQLYHCLCEKILSREVRYRVSPRGQRTSIQLPEMPYLSIDLGTSYTLIAVMDAQNTPHLIPDHTGSFLHRSTILFTENGDYQIGTDSPQAIRHIKRKIGVKDTISVNGEARSVTLLVAMILKSMVRNAQEYLNTADFRLILSMPTDFSLVQKNILLESARLAGVEVNRVVQESAVEALLPSKADRHFAAFIDMGGGTLDISLADIDDGFMNVCYSDGDSNFGSLDFDADMTQLLAHKLQEDHGVRGENLEVLAEQVKCRLSTQEQVTVTYLDSDAWGDMRMLPLTVTRQEFEAAARPRIRQFHHKLLQLDNFRKSEESWKAASLEVIYLTGQGTKLYILKNLIEEVFPGIRVVDRYQESAVIRGLSRLMQSFFDPDLLLLNAIPSSILYRGSVSEKEGLCHIRLESNPEKICLLERDTTIPTLKSHALIFDFPEGMTQPCEFPLEILEKTVSGWEHTLVSTKLMVDPAKNYDLSIDIDAVYRVRICIHDADSREVIREYRF